MKITRLTSEKAPIWNNFIEENTETNFYQLLGWKEVFESVFKYQSHYLIAHNDNEHVQGILPLFLMRDIVRKRYLVSNPFSNFAGITAATPEAEQALVAEAAGLASSLQAEYVEYRQLKQPLAQKLPARESFVTLMLELASDLDKHWTGLSSRNRNKIRKAEKNGLRVDFGMKHLSAFHKVYSINLRYLGTPIFPLRMFEKVSEVFGESVELLVLKMNDKVVSGMFLFMFKEMISEPWVASLREYNKIYVNNCLYWQAIKFAIERGFKLFDFGRSTIGTGTYDFKLQWGAKPVPLHYQYSLNRAKAVPVVDANDNKYQTAIDVWKKLPQGVTNFVGPIVVQYLPEL